MKHGILAIAIVAALAFPAAADVTLHGLFTDHMVIQRDTRAPVWGSAAPGEKITVSGSWGKKASTTAKANGRWLLKLATPAAGGPYVITVSGKNTRTLKNVLSGDVWVCGGQSNMDWPLSNLANPKNKPAHVAADSAKLIEAKHDAIRVILLDKQYRARPQEGIVVQAAFENSWQACVRPEITGATTAVGFFFARTLNTGLDVPIGLIDANRGGTRVELWMSREALGETAIPEEKDGVAKGNSVLYNGMIAPLMPFAIKGAIWYQGESNSKTIADTALYAKNFPGMIDCWRDNWGQGKFPFLYVQLAAFRTASQGPVPAADLWPYLRESQDKALRMRNTGMASAIDAGLQGDIHPWMKETVGRRLAAAAQKVAHGMDAVHTGPTYARMRVHGNEAVIQFKHTGAGLRAKNVELDGIQLNARELKGFVICGADKIFVWADARIDGGAVIVSSPEVDRPAAVRYAWADFPLCNLYNEEGFPANPFRTDNFTPAK